MAAGARRLCAAAHASAQPRLEAGEAGSYNLAPYLAVLEDPQGKLQLADVLREPERFRPVPGSGPSANFGLTRSAIWLRVVVRTPATSAPEWLLELAYPPLDHMTLFTPNGLGGWDEQAAGDLLPFDSRPIAHRNHVLPVRLPPAATPPCTCGSHPKARSPRRCGCGAPRRCGRTTGAAMPCSRSTSGC
ncbi:hypothetical protein HK414_12295 [Ramlibacter terrae]|uniref:7TM-DISM receptor extracellular domain-containing protein n=1 Tax=Ramlibacter terrae TaxID=2732511 RepID=A0ABX6P6I5_9BURK|nr:hypothetical protein HK414_12295 [Ramlibacter terrae]